MRISAALLAIAILGLSSPAAAAPHGVRLTWFADPTTSVAISWNSDSAADAMVLYGTSPDALTQMATGTSVMQPSPLGLAFTAKLTGLAPGTTYYYRVAGDPAAGQPPFSFTTMAADPCAPFRFVLIGDNRADTDGVGPSALWSDVLDESMAHTPQFFVNTGDMVKNGEAPEEWANFIDASEKGWALVPSLLTMGNHDEDSVNGDGAIYNQLYELPRNPDGVEDYYSIDVGPIHFVSVNTQYTNPGSTDFDKQKAWLAADLAATTQPWKIVFFHKAVYSRGNHFTGEEDDGAINAAFVPIFDANQVDLVFNGHSHNYERYAPSRGVDAHFGGAGRLFPAGAGSALGMGAMLPDGATGTTYMVSGGAGALTTEIAGFECIDSACTFCLPFVNNCEASVYQKDVEGTAVYNGKHNFVVIEVNGDELTATMHTTVAGNIGGGEVADEFTITKSSFGLQCGTPMPPDAGVPSGFDGGNGGDADGGGIGGGIDAGGGGNLNGDSSGGCGCRAGGAGSRGGMTAAALLLGALLLPLRRRRGRRA